MARSPLNALLRTVAQEAHPKQGLGSISKHKPAYIFGCLMRMPLSCAMASCLQNPLTGGPNQAEYHVDGVFMASDGSCARQVDCAHPTPGRASVIQACRLLAGSSASAHVERCCALLAALRTQRRRSAAWSVEPSVAP